MKLTLDTPAKVKAFAEKVKASYNKLSVGLNLGGFTFADWDKEQNELEAELDEAQKLLPSGLCVGRVVHFGVADGYATYLITKLGKRISKVVHLPFGDAYRYQGVEADGSVFTSCLR